MKAAAFDYLRPASINEALAALRDADGAGRLMGGGQSLGPMLNLRLARPAQVIDAGSLAELRTVVQDGAELRIGAGITHAEIEDGAFPALRGTLLQQVAGGIAYRAIRNRGTLGGSLAHADPAADWLVVMRALGAVLELCGPTGTRRLPLAQFVVGAYATVLADDEMIVAVRLPATLAKLRWGYHKFCRKPGEFAHASCAAVFDGTSATVVLGALDGAPRELPTLAQALREFSERSMPLDALASDLDTDPRWRSLIGAAVAQAMPSGDAIDHQLHGECVLRCLRQLSATGGQS